MRWWGGGVVALEFTELPLHATTPPLHYSTTSCDATQPHHYPTTQLPHATPPHYPTTPLLNYLTRSADPSLGHTTVAMVDPPPVESEPEPQAATPWWLKVIEIVLQGSALLIAIAALVWLLAPVIQYGTIPLEWTPQALLCAAAFLCVCAVTFRSYRWWASPTRRLIRLLPAIQRGDMPVGSLADIDGGLRPLVPVLEALLLELAATAAR